MPGKTKQRSSKKRADESSRRPYGKAASKKVGKALHERKRGTLAP